MTWIKIKEEKYDSTFYAIINDLVFHCPSSHRKKKDGKSTYYPVSNRNNSFRERKIEKTLLATLLSCIKALFDDNSFRIIKKNAICVSELVNDIQRSSKDAYKELFVCMENTNMSDAETVFYYIRNAFAHGSFEVVCEKGKRIYILESKKEEMIKARMRLTEETLLEICKLSKLKASDLRKKQKKKGKRR